MANSTSYNIAPLFEPSKNDYAIGLLHQIFGSAMDKLSGVHATSTGYAQATTITTAVAAFNLLVLFCAICVSSYTIYSSIANTSTDGQWGGKSINLQWTSLKSFIAMFGLVPLPSGFTVVQIVVLQWLVWGSAAADYANNKVSEKLVNNSASYIASSQSTTNWVETGKIANVMSGMVRDQLCALYANRISNDLQTGSAPLQTSIVHRSLGFTESPNSIISDAAIEWGFRSGNAYQNLSSMCGSVIAYYKSPSQKLLNGTMTDSAATYAEHLNTLAEQAAKSGVENVFASLSASSGRIAQKIYDGSRDTDALKQEITTDIQTAASSYFTGATINTGQVSALGKSLLEASASDGWVYAALWQRVLSEYAVRVTMFRNDVDFVTNDSINPKAAGSLRARYFGWLGLGSSEERAAFSDIDDSYDYLKNFDSLYKKAGDPIKNMDGNTSLERMSAADQQASGIAPIQWLYNYLLNDLAEPTTNGWRDPMISIQEEGQWFMRSGVEVQAAAVIAPTAMAAASGVVAGPEASIGGYFAGKYVGAILSTLGKALVFLGFIAAVFLPFMPFVYFLSGVFAWIVMSVEALVAASLWLLLALTPSRNDGLVGDNRQGFMLLIAVIMRPILMIVGLYFCYVLLFVGMSLVKTLMRGAYMVMAPNSSIFNAMTAAGLLGMYIVLVFIITLFSCSLITGLGDSVMQWIGVNVSALGKNAIADNVASVANPAQLAGQRLLGAPGAVASAVGDARRASGARGARTEAANSRGSKIGRSMRFRLLGK